MEWLIWLGLEVGAHEIGITDVLSSFIKGIFEGMFGVFILAYKYSLLACIALVVIVTVVFGALEKQPKMQNLFIEIIGLIGCILTEHYFWGAMVGILIIQDLLKKED